MSDDEKFMRLALDEAGRAAARGEVPVGAVLVGAQGEVLAQAGNKPITLSDPTAHAEILAIRAAAEKTGNERLTGTTLYVTVEPCAMCAGAIAMARIARLVYGAGDPKGGAVAHGAKFFTLPTCHHRPELRSGVLAEESGSLLKDFFRARR